MDYTIIPRSLIYKDREDIDSFSIEEEGFDISSMEGLYLSRLEERPFIKEYIDAPALILKIFNNARYITTLICMENHPTHYLRKYLAKAYEDNRSLLMVNHVMPATMALVRNYLYYYVTDRMESKIVKKITKHFDTDAWRNDTIGGQDDFYDLVLMEQAAHPRWLSDEDFDQRDIKEVISDQHVSPVDIAIGIDYVIDRIYGTFEDKDIVPCLIAIKQRLEEPTSKSILESSYTLQYDHAIRQLEDAFRHSQIPWEDDMPAVESDRVEYGKGNEALKSEIEHLKKEKSDLQAEIDRLKAENAELKRQIDLEEKESASELDKKSQKGKETVFTLRERIVFFMTVLSLENNKKYTHKSNLATFISAMCNDQHHIGPMISKMEKPEQAPANAKAAKHVASQMKLILPDEYRKDEHLKINKLINSMNNNFPEAEE